MCTYIYRLRNLSFFRESNIWCSRWQYTRMIFIFILTLFCYFLSWEDILTLVDKKKMWPAYPTTWTYMYLWTFSIEGYVKSQRCIVVLRLKLALFHQNINFQINFFAYEREIFGSTFSHIWKINFQMNSFAYSMQEKLSVPLVKEQLSSIFLYTKEQLSDHFFLLQYTRATFRSIIEHFEFYFGDKTTYK